jgi:hypothetical protein
MYRPENIKQSESLTLGVYYSPTVGLWKPVAGFGMTQQRLAFGEAEKQSYNKPYFNYSFRNSFKLPANITLRADLVGNLRGHSGQSYVYDTYRIDAQVNKSFLNGNLIFIVRAVDLLGSYRGKSLVEIAPITIWQTQIPDMQSVQFSITYSFNSTRNKYKGETASEAERSRM